VGDGDADDGDHRQRGGGGGEAEQLVPLALDETLPLDEVFRGVDADLLLLEHRYRHVVGGHPLGLGERPVDVGAEGADLPATPVASPEDAG